jgi:hypothetical protein
VLLYIIRVRRTSRCLPGSPIAVRLLGFPFHDAASACCGALLQRDYSRCSSTGMPGLRLRWFLLLSGNVHGFPIQFAGILVLRCEQAVCSRSVSTDAAVSSAVIHGIWCSLCVQQLRVLLNFGDSTKDPHGGLRSSRTDVHIHKFCG